MDLKYVPRIVVIITTLTCYSPYKFEAPWSAWEFASHVLHKEANLVILSMAWLTRENARSYSRCPKDPDMETLSYWLARMEPLIRAETEGEIICVFANRTGIEDEAVYAGTSAVLGIHAGEVKVYGILGRGEKELLVVDTNKRPQAKLVSEPNSTASDAKEIDSRDSKSATDWNDNPAVDGNYIMDRLDSIMTSGIELNPDERTNSTVSDRSDLSIDTQTTACTIPDPVDASFPKTIEDVITPLSPVDASSPSAFYSPIGRRPEGETLRESLKSSIGQKQFQAPKPDSPTFVRPPSPKSRNASRTRQAEQQEPALISHDLAKEEQITYLAVGVQSPPIPIQPHSAAAAPDRYQPSFMASYFGPRGSYLTPRPKSAVF
jgi:protein N-terminal amidase